jgi:hypothetical protein
MEHLQFWWKVYHPRFQEKVVMGVAELGLCHAWTAVGAAG